MQVELWRNVDGNGIEIYVLRTILCWWVSATLVGQ